MSRYGKHNIHCIAGDFNARLMTRLPNEADILGPHIYREPDAQIETLSDKQQSNREHFVDFCMEFNYIPQNTWKDKAMHDLATYRGPRPRFCAH